MTVRDRGRLTPVDVVFFGVGFTALAFLGEPFYSLLSQNSGDLGTGTEFLFTMIVPGLVLTLLFSIYAISFFDLGGS